MLTPLQERVARLVGALPEPGELALAGGAALIVAAIVDRQTRDLDYFTPDASAMPHLRRQLEAALVGDGLTFSLLREAETFLRYEVSDGHEHVRLDFAQDARLHDVVTTRLGPALDPRELAADKVLALWGRAEARDFVDVDALVARFGWEALLRWAAEKDAGFDVTHFVESTAAFHRLDDSDFDLTDDSYAALRHRVLSWPPAITDTPRT